MSSLFGDGGSSKHVKDMKHHVVISEEIIEERKTKSKKEAEEVIQEVEETEGKSSKELIQGVKETKGKSSTRRRDQAKEHYEKKRRVTKPIALDDLFKRRSLKPGDPESEVRSVLLYGNPGSGKTCITKVVAHKWALGEMAQEFETVYVVPVRALNGTDSKGQQWTSLEEAISRICFSKRNRASEYKDLALLIEDALDDRSTLLVVDGLDEANDNARELVSTTWERSCKVLFLSRPYNMRNVETRVDIQVECLGFNDEQLREYIRSELSDDEAPRFIRFLENTAAMWEMAHIPVTAHILCCLSTEHGTAVDEEKKRASAFQVYNDMANYVWKRFEEKQVARNVQKAELFNDLEKIAFESLRKGRILIHERFVMQHATSKNAARTFKESGLLLLVLEGQEYQFPHLTYQEYFAGRYIARMLKQKESDEKTRVLDFIREGKYDEKHKLTLTFAMHAFAKDRSKQALKELLSIINEQPVEVLGIRHFFLRMRLLEAILEETDEKDLEDVLNDEHAIKLVESARQLLERTVDNILIREIVVNEFQQLSRVLEESPQLLDDTIDEVKTLMGHSRALTRMEITKITAVLKLAKNSSKHCNDIQQFLAERVKAPEGWCHTSESIRRLNSIAEQMPQQIAECLPTLAKGCGNKDWQVRQAAVEAIGRVVVASPQHAVECLPSLEKWCGDEDWQVRRAAMQAIGRVVAASPQHAVECLPSLAKWCGDKHEYVRQAAMEAIDRVVAASPQHAVECLPTLAEGCVDDDSDVRQGAMEAIDRVVAASPQHAVECLPTLAEGCGDEDWQVRQAAVEAIGRVVAVAPQHAVESQPTLAKRCSYFDRDVRQAAMEAIGRVVAAAPQHAGEYLPTLAKGCGDEDWHVRQRAMAAIGRVVEVSPQHAGEYLPTLAKGCCDEDWHVRQAAMVRIGRIVEVSPQHAGEYLPTLAKGCCDEDWHVRQAAMVRIGRIVEVSPQHAVESLPTLAKGCGDEDLRVRQGAMEAIGRVVAASPQHAVESLPTLAKRCGDFDRDVRQAAMEAIGRVVAVAPQHAVESLPTLAKRCSYFDRDVRQAAMEAIGRVVAAAPQHAGEYLPTLAKGCGDEDWHVRQRAMAAIGRVVEVSPQHAGEYLPTLAKGCCDEDWHVRQAAMVRIGRIVEVSPQHAGEYLPTLVTGCADEDKDVRQAAMAAIGRVVEVSPQHAGEYLPTLAKGCGDEHEDVRNAAKAALERVKLGEAVSTAISSFSTHNGGLFFFFVQNSFTLDPRTILESVPFVLHSSSSQEIGKWNKEAIDVFIECLRQACEEKFPGLLESISSKE